MLTLRPSRPAPVRAGPGRAELVALWDGLDAEGRKLVLSNARAVAEMRGRLPYGVADVSSCGRQSASTSPNSAERPNEDG